MTYALNTEIDGVVEILPAVFSDHRGNFVETFRDDWFSDNISSQRLVQENQSVSRNAGTIRGLHYQTDPMAQGKLVRCAWGAVFDVAVDIRPGSPNFGTWVARTLTAEQGNQLWVPAGFLHGFCTLTDDAVVSYKVTSYYSPAHDSGVAWDDSDIGVAWPAVARPDLLSDKDRAQPRLRDLLLPRVYAGGLA